MIAVQETTVWDVEYKQPNHIYLLDGDKAVAYIKWGQGEPFYFKNPLRIDKRGRKFVELKKNPFKVEIKSNIVKVSGSKGDTYFVDLDSQTCTCAGFQFRGRCKHIESVLQSNNGKG